MNELLGQEYLLIQHDSSSGSTIEQLNRSRQSKLSENILAASKALKSRWGDEVLIEIQYETHFKPFPKVCTDVMFKESQTY